MLPFGLTETNYIEVEGDSASKEFTVENGVLDEADQSP
jgi:hypothetical protein